MLTANRQAVHQAQCTWRLTYLSTCLQNEYYKQQLESRLQGLNSQVDDLEGDFERATKAARSQNKANALGKRRDDAKALATVNANQHWRQKKVEKFQQQTQLGKQSEKAAVMAVRFLPTLLPSWDSPSIAARVSLCHRACADRQPLHSLACLQGASQLGAADKFAGAVCQRYQGLLSPARPNDMHSVALFVS